MAARTVSIYRIQPDGQVGDPIWTLYKSNPNSICHAFTWQGDQLLFSQSDTKDGKRVQNLSQEELEALRNTPGKTFRFNPVTKVVKEILPTAYKVLVVNKDNTRLAAGTPVGTGKKGASLSFFDLGTNKSLGEWNEPKWDELGDQMPYLLDWGSEGTGVFVVGPHVSPPGTTNAFPQPNLFYVSLEGKAKQVGHTYASMISGYEGMLPLGVVGENNTATVVTVNGNGFMGISRSNRERAERSYTWTSIQKIVLPTAAKPWDLNPVAVTPNARMVLVQVPKTPAPEESITEADFWLIDFQDKRRRKLGTFPMVSHAYRWEGDRLIVAVNKPDGDSNFGFFQLPEAALPADSPQLQQILQTTPWEGAPKPTEPTVPTVAAQFLRQPDLTKISAPDSWQRGPQPMTFLHDLATLSPIGATKGDAVLGVNEKTMRVQYFRAPMPSAVAEVPIKPEAATKAAETFAHANFAALFAPGGTARIRVAVPINERGNYSVEVRRVEKGVLLPSRALVEVSASDGKIASYTEDDTPTTVRPEDAKATREAARQAVEATFNAQAQKEISAWVQEKQEVALINGKQQVVWDMVVALKSKNVAEAPLTYARYMVSGETGRVLQSQILPLSEPQMKAFRALGGADLPTAEELKLLAEPDFRDRFPRPAPDGQTIAFLSNRPRPGVPEWWRARPDGLFLVKRDGTELQNVAPRAEGAMQWSPRGRSLVFDEGDYLAVYDLTTRTRVPVPSPATDLKLGMAVWISEDTLLLTGQRSSSAVLELFEWRSSNPQATPRSLSSNWGQALALPGRPIALARSQDDKSLYLLVRKINDTVGECSYALYSQPIGEPLSKPKIVADCLPFGEHLQVTNDSVFILGAGGVLKLDPVTGNFTLWKLSSGSSMPVYLAGEMTDKVGFLPDGRTYVVAAPTTSGEKNNSLTRKQTLFLSSGQELKSLFP